MTIVNSLILINFTVAYGAFHTLVFLSTGRWKSQAQLDFEQLTIFDNITVSKCNGVTYEEQFKPSLQKTALPDRCDEAHRNILESIYNILDLTNNTVDVVQRRRGCRSAADGSETAFDTWALNGDDFLTLDLETLTWISKSHSSVKIKEIWDKSRTRSHAFRAFLKNFCPEMIQQMSLKAVPKNTELRVFAKPVENSEEAQLLCHVTTTDSSVKSVRLIGNGATRVSGFSVMGPLPSGGASWVLRLSGRISLSLTHLTYGCAVQSDNHNLTIYWDGTTLDGRHIYYRVTYKFLNAILGFLALIGFILVMSCAMIALLRIIKMRKRPRAPPPRPELKEQFETILQSSTLPPEIRSILLSVLHGSNTPDIHRESQIQWLEMKERENYYDPEFYGGWV